LNQIGHEKIAFVLMPMLKPAQKKSIWNFKFNTEL